MLLARRRIVKPHLFNSTLKVMVSISTTQHILNFLVRLFAAQMIQHLVTILSIFLLTTLTRNTLVHTFMWTIHQTFITLDVQLHQTQIFFQTVIKVLIISPYFTNSANKIKQTNFYLRFLYFSLFPTHVVLLICSSSTYSNCKFVLQICIILL